MLLTLHRPHVARQYYAAGIWRDETLYGLLESHAALRPAAFAVRDARQRLTWTELLRWTDAVAASLHASGVRRGERVSIWLPSRVEALVAFLACARNGYVCNPSLHQNYRVAEVGQLLRRLRSSALVAQPGYGSDARDHDIFELARGLPEMRSISAVQPTPDSGVAPFPKIEAPPASIAPDRDPDKVVYLAFTSGTTGQPKGVMHSDNTLLANGRAMVDDWYWTSDDVVLSLSPLSHHIATVAIEQSLVCGMELVLADPAARRSGLEWIDATSPTYVMGVPTHAIDVLSALSARESATLGRVRVFYMAGATIPREVAQRFVALGVTPQNVYGMTENGSHQYTLPSDDMPTVVGTCGRACDAYQVRLFQPDHPDEPVAEASVGEIGGRGGALMLGYFDDQTATESSFNRDGWFMSGDLGRFDANGCLIIIGRKKDLIIRGGHNIHPARIEDLAHRHVGVAKAAVFPIDDDRLGERACIAIIRRSAPAFDADQLLAHLHGEGLSVYDMPEYYVELDTFPLTASGKILKRELVEWARSGRIRPTTVRFRLGGA